MRVKFHPVGHSTGRSEEGCLSSLRVVSHDMSGLHIRLIRESDVAEIDRPVWCDGGSFCEMCTVEEFFKFGVRGKDGIVACSVPDQYRG